MIRKISRSEGPFVRPEIEGFDEQLYFKGCSDLDPSRAYAYSHIQRSGDFGYLHLNVVRWSTGILRLMRRDLEDLKAVFRARGIKRVMGMHPMEGCDKWAHFIQLIGFPEPAETQVDGIGLVLGTILEV